MMTKKNCHVIFVTSGLLFPSWFDPVGLIIAEPFD